MNDEVALDVSQGRAVRARADQPTRVVAGAGTGKTTVLVERYLELVRRDGFEPERILALTFTLKAAAEMRHRVHEAMAGASAEAAAEADPARVERLYGAWIMNFHQFGLRIIRENAPAFAVDPRVDVVSPAEFQRIKQLLRRRFLEGRIEGASADFGGEMPPPTKLDSHFALFFDAAMRCRSDGLDPVELRVRCRPNDQPGYIAFVDCIVAVARAYDEQLRRRNLIDFSDMITLPARVLAEDAGLRERYASRFDHILVDEFQDTSRAQFALLELLAQPDFANVTVVGDRKQSIYRWRDARVENLDDFPGSDEPLEVNYRSRQRILDLAHAFITRDAAFAGETALAAHRGDGPEPVVLFHPRDEESSEAEAAALAGWVRHQVEGRAFGSLPARAGGGAMNYGDVAVLLRSLKPSWGLPHIERVFEEQRIPYAVIGGANATETRALERWHALLSLLLPGDRVRELLSVLDHEPFAVPDASLHELLRDVKHHPDRGTAWLDPEHVARVTDAAAAQRLRALGRLVDDMRQRWVTDDLRSFLAWTIAESPLALHLFQGDATPRAADDLVAEIFDAVETLDRRNELSLPVFLEHLRAAVDEKKFREESDVRLPRGRVCIMTIHQAKGLEFPAVAVAGIRLPRENQDRFYISREDGIFFSFKDKSNWGRGYDDSEARQRELVMEAQEARCLLYVAMTRACDALWVSSPLCDGRKQYKKKATDTLFADVLAVAQTMDDVVVVRDAPRPTPTPAAVADEEVVPELEAALARWRDVRAASGTGRLAAPLAAPAFVTWAGLRAFARCPLQYRYRYRSAIADVFGGKGRETPDAPDAPGADEHLVPGAVSIPRGVEPALYGAIVHDALRRLTADGREPAAAASEAVQAHGILQRRRPVVETATARLLEAVRASDLGRVGDDARAEESFEVRIGDVVVVGVFDRIERVDGGARVVDYKIGVEDPDHGFQVQVYAWALARIWEVPVTGTVCYVREDGVTAKDVVDAASSAAVDALVSGLADAFARGALDATPAPEVCGACPFRTVCAEAAAAD